MNYKYLVSMLGYCQSWKKQILVYEYMVGGDLTKRLRGMFEYCSQVTLSLLAASTDMSVLALCRGYRRQ